MPTASEVRPHGKAPPGYDPTEEAVTHILRVEVLPLIVIGLLPNLEGVDKPDFFEGLVPFEDSVTDRPAEAHRHGLLDVEDDGLFGLAYRQRRITLDQVPAVNVAVKQITGAAGFGPILMRGHEVPDPIIGDAGLVAGLRELPETEMYHLLVERAGRVHSAYRQFDADLDVQFEGLLLGPLAETRVDGPGAGRGPGKVG